MSVGLLLLLQHFPDASFELFDVLDVLELGPVTASLHGDRILIKGPADDIEALRPWLTKHRDLIRATLVGRRSGHAPAPCNECSAVSMVAVKTPAGKARKPWPRCRLTPRCDGRHVPRTEELERARHGSPPPAQAPAPDHDDDRKRFLGTKPSWPTDETPRDAA